ncbi:MAG: hypothetical protein HZB43_04690 [candidate division Zixibacteria bacterium]|nr:hypothetical protein [candidate division Zixibacteria bacterium]
MTDPTPMPLRALILIGLISLIGPITPVSAQSLPFARSAWSNYTFVNDAMGLAASGDTLWVATTGGLVRFTADAPDSQSRFTNVDGLGDIDLRFVALDSGGQVWTGGSRGRLSRHITDRSWNVYNFDIDGARIPLHAASPGPNDFLWVASDIGVHKFDMNRNGGEIKESYMRLGNWPASNPVHDVLVTGGDVWVVGPSGAARGNVFDQFLLVPEHWKSWADIPSLNALASFQNRIYAGGDDGLYAFVDTPTAPGDTVWTKVGFNQLQIRDLLPSGDTLWIATSTGLACYTGGQAITPAALGSPNVAFTSVARTSDGTTWTGQLGNGLLTFRNDTWTPLRFAGPLGAEFGDLAIATDGRVWCVHPTRGADFLDNGRWTTLPYVNAGPGNPATSVAITPNGAVWFGSWGSGAYKVNAVNPLSDWLRYDTANSSLMWVRDPVGVNNYIVVRDIATDSVGRVWFANAAADSGQVLAYFDPAGGCWGAFATFDGFTSDNPAVLLALDQEVLVGFGGSGLVDMTYSGALCSNSNPVTPPIHLTFKTTDNGLPSNEIRALLVDRADSLWVGTNVGLVRWAADIRLFLRVPLPAEAGLSVNTLAADALNNVWVGTDRGLVMIPSSRDTAFYFSPENSGLAGSDVRQIAVNERTGELWIGTASGLSRLAAGVPMAESLDDILAYPNPLELETGIHNLVRFNAPFGSRIYIYTVAGEPVADFDAAAGWDGRNKGGITVASGVYLFVVRGPDGNTGRGKIAVLRRQ